MSVIDSLSLGGSTYSLRDNDGRAIIAGTESSTTSAHAYSTGDYFILNDTLYEATDAIAVGGTITVGTNCQATTVCGEVGELKSGFANIEDAIGTSVTVTGNPIIFNADGVHTGAVTAENATLVAVYGNQLFCADRWSGNPGVSSVADGIITFNGNSATSSANNTVATPFLPKGHTYTVKVEAADANTKYCRFALRDNNGGTVNDTNAYVELPFSINMTPSQNIYKMSAVVKHETSDTVNVGAIRVTISYGSTAGDYEPYVGAVYDISDPVSSVNGANLIVADTTSALTFTYGVAISSAGLQEQITQNAAEIAAIKNPDIVGKNADVLSAVNAAGAYGMKTTGGVSKHTLTMLISTDAHSYDFDEIANMVAYLNATDGVDIGISLGDMSPSNYNDSATSYISAVAQSEKPFYTIYGNHDIGNNTSTTDSSTVANAFIKWVKDATSIEDLALPYYKVDTDFGITLIFLNNYDVPDTISGGVYTVSRGAEVVTQTQIDWLISTLASVPSGNTVVIFRHSFPDANNAVACNFTMKSAALVGNGTACYTDVVPDIVNAWKNGTSLQKTYAPNVSGISDSLVVDCDFTSRGMGKFAGDIVGHSHKDVVAKCRTYDDQIAIGFEATSYVYYQNAFGDLPRVMGEKSQDAITVVSVDPDAKLIKLVRVGSNRTVRMVDRTMLAIEYT